MTTPNSSAPRRVFTQPIQIGMVQRAPNSLSVQPAKIELAIDLSPGASVARKPDGYRCEYTTSDGKTGTLPGVYSGFKVE